MITRIVDDTVGWGLMYSRIDDKTIDSNGEEEERVDAISVLTVLAGDIYSL